MPQGLLADRDAGTHEDFGAAAAGVRGELTGQAGLAGPGLTSQQQGPTLGGGDLAGKGLHPAELHCAPHEQGRRRDVEHVVLG